MTPQQRQQLEILLQEQARLAEAVKGFDERLRNFMAGVEKKEEAEAIDWAQASVARPAPPEPVHLPPPLPQPMAPAPAPRAEVPVPLAPTEERGEAGLAEATVERSVVEATPGEGASTPRLEAAPALAAREPQSLEMTLGTVWLARIGIVILVTGLVFLGNFAYQHIVHRLGPGGKVSLLYSAAAGLAGLGAWLQKRLNTEGRFPQVLMAGGAATAYYTTYAAHFVAPLRIIESDLAGGILLLLVGGIFGWWADRKKLQTAALLGIVLSYYTAAINPIGSFTVYSSALLSAAAGLLLVRNGWAMVSWASLVGTYGSYLYWVWSRNPSIVGSGPLQDQDYFTAGLPVNLWVLALYWLVFTLSVFAARTESFSSVPRVTFLSLNNLLFFALGSPWIWRWYPHQYWLFVLIYGGGLLVLAALARLRHVKDYALDASYLVQGLGAITAGLALKLAGTQLAITLAVESAVLLSAVTRRHGAIYRIGAVATAVWAFCLTLDRMNEDAVLIVPLGATVAAFLIFDAWWLKQRSGWLPAMRWSWRAAGFAGLGMLLIGFVLTLEVHDPWEPPSLAVAALVATASVYLLQLPEVVLLGQLFLAAAVGQWLTNTYSSAPRLTPWTPWWQPLPIICAALALAHWWQRQRILRSIASDPLHMVCALGFVAIGYFWSKLWLAGESFAVVLACAGVATMVYGYFTRAWAISLLGQVFAIGSVHEAFTHFGAQHFPWFITLLPVAGLVAAAAVYACGDEQRWPAELRPGLKRAVAFYWLLTFALIVAWVFEYIPTRWQLLLFASLGAMLFLSGARWPDRPRTYTGLAFSAVTFFVFWTRFVLPGWPDLLALLLLPASIRLAHRRAPTAQLPAPWPDALVGLTTASVWWWVTRWTYGNHHAEMLTVAWTGLAVAVFVAGLSLRDRIYRIGGFLILALAIGRIFLVDVRKLETIYRILSFMVLGIVLLALGFVYNRYAEKIRRWL